MAVFENVGKLAGSGLANDFFVFLVDKKSDNLNDLLVGGTLDDVLEQGLEQENFGIQFREIADSGVFVEFV